MKRIDVSGISHVHNTCIAAAMWDQPHIARRAQPRRRLPTHSFTATSSSAVEHLHDSCTIPPDFTYKSIVQQTCPNISESPPPGIIHVIVFTNRRVTWHRTPFITPSPSHAALVSPCTCMSSALFAWMASNWTHCLTSNSI